MKKLFSISFALMLLPLFHSQAQFISQGSITGGGSVGFGIESEKSDFAGTVMKYKAISFSLAPSVQYYVIDNLGVGGLISFGTGSTKGKDIVYESSYTNVLIGPAVRYYISNGAFATASYAFGVSKSKGTSGFGESESTSNIGQLNFAVGYSIRINDNILLDPTIGYERYGIKDKDDDYQNSQGGIYLRAGFTMILNRK